MPAHLARDFVGKALGHRGLEHVRQAALRVAGGAPDQQPRRIDPDLHLGEAQLHGLKFHNRLAELHAFLHVRQHVLQGAAGLCQRHRRVAAALEIEGFHQLAKATCGQNHILKWYAALREIQIAGRHPVEAHQCFLPAKRQARRVLLNIYRADALGARLIGHAAIDHVAIGMAAARAPALGAVEHHAVALHGAQWLPDR